MKYQNTFTALDVRMAESLCSFVPSRVYDFHAHFYHAAHYPDNPWSAIAGEMPSIDHRDWLQALKRHPAFCGKPVSGLFFGAVAKSSDTEAMNRFIADEVAALGDPYSAFLLVVTPQSDRSTIQHLLREGRCRGIKVYHCYSDRAESMNAEIPEYAPEWMWAALDEISGVMMLHLVLPGAIADARNQRDIRRMSERYPNVKLVLAHAARCFSHRHAVGMASIADLPNVYIDTSAVCEAASLLEALKQFGPRRVLYGSDFFVSEIRGRCVTQGEGFRWLYHGELDGKEEASQALIGLESLMALKEAMEQFGATAKDREDVFWNNAMRLLGEEREVLEPQKQWQRAREVISCGTGLLSKRAESFLTPDWPIGYTRASGAKVWDLNGRMFRDFVGGVGAILLGYSDPDVNKAVERRLFLGSYTSLQAPEEITLAERLLALHPGMDKVRYARGGGDAVAVAVRIARAATGKSGVIFCGYHGWHDWSLAANLGCESGSYAIPGLCASGVPKELEGTATPFFYNDLESLQNASFKQRGNLAAIVMEPLRSQFPKPEFIEKIRAIRRETNALLVVDEVTSGLRYGFPGASAQLGLPADLLVYAKAMSNGVPFGVVIGKQEPMDAASSSFISSSYWTDGLGPAAALAVLDKMQREEIFPRLQKRGADFQRALAEIVSRFPSLGMQIGGMPASPTLIYPDKADGLTQRVSEEMIKRGFLLSRIIYLMDAHSDADMARFLIALEQALEVVAEEKQRGVIAVKAANVGPVIGRLT